MAYSGTMLHTSANGLSSDPQKTKEFWINIGREVLQTYLSIIHIGCLPVRSIVPSLLFQYLSYIHTELLSLIYLHVNIRS